MGHEGECQATSGTCVMLIVWVQLLKAAWHSQLSLQIKWGEFSSSLWPWTELCPQPEQWPCISGHWVGWALLAGIYLQGRPSMGAQEDLTGQGQLSPETVRTITSLLQLHGALHSPPGGLFWHGANATSSAALIFHWHGYLTCPSSHSDCLKLHLHIFRQEFGDTPQHRKVSPDVDWNQQTLAHQSHFMTVTLASRYFHVQVKVLIIKFFMDRTGVSEGSCSSLWPCMAIKVIWEGLLWVPSPAGAKLLVMTRTFSSIGGKISLHF